MISGPSSPAILSNSADAVTVDGLALVYAFRLESLFQSGPGTYNTKLYLEQYDYNLGLVIASTQLYSATGVVAQSERLIAKGFKTGGAVAMWAEDNGHTIRWLTIDSAGTVLNSQTKFFSGSGQANIHSDACTDSADGVVYAARTGTTVQAFRVTSAKTGSPVSTAFTTLVSNANMQGYVRLASNWLSTDFVLGWADQPGTFYEISLRKFNSSFGLLVGSTTTTLDINSGTIGPVPYLLKMNQGDGRILVAVPYNETVGQSGSMTIMLRPANLSAVGTVSTSIAAGFATGSERKMPGGAYYANGDILIMFSRPSTNQHRAWHMSTTGGVFTHLSGSPLTISDSVSGNNFYGHSLDGTEHRAFYGYNHSSSETRLVYLDTEIPIQTYVSSSNLKKQNIDKSSVASADLRKTSEATYQLSAFLLSTRSATYDLSSNLLKVVSNSFDSSVDLLKLDNDLAFDSSAALQITPSVTYDISSLLQSTPSVTHESSANLKKFGIESSFVSSSQLQDREDKTFDASASLQSTVSVTYFASSNFLKTETSTYDASASLLSSNIVTFSMTARLVAVRVFAYDGSANLLATESTTFSESANLFKSNISHSFDSSLQARKTENRVFDASASLQSTAVVTYLSSADLVATVSQNLGLSTNLQKSETSTFASSANMMSTEDVLHTSSSNLLSRPALSFSSSAVLGDVVISTFDISANLIALQSRPVTMSANLIRKNIDRSFVSSAGLLHSVSSTYSVSSNLRSQNTHSYALSSRLIRLNNDRTHQSSANLRKTSNRSNTSSASLRATKTKSYQSSASLRARQNKNFVSSADLLASTPRTYSSSANLVILKSNAYTLSGSLLDTVDESFDSSSSLVQSQSKFFDESANLLRTNVVTHSVSSALVNARLRTADASVALHKPGGFFYVIKGAALRPRTRDAFDTFDVLANAGSSSMASDPQGRVFSVWIEDPGTIPCSPSSQRRLMGRIDSAAFQPLTDTTQLSSLYGWESVKAIYDAVGDRWIVVAHQSHIIKYSIYDQDLNPVIEDRTVTVKAPIASSVARHNFDIGCTDSKLVVVFGDGISVVDLETGVVDLIAPNVTNTSGPNIVSVHSGMFDIIYSVGSDIVLDRYSMYDIQSSGNVLISGYIVLPENISICAYGVDRLFVAFESGGNLHYQLFDDLTPTYPLRTVPLGVTASSVQASRGFQVDSESHSFYVKVGSSSGNKVVVIEPDRLDESGPDSIQILNDYNSAGTPIVGVNQFMYWHMYVVEEIPADDVMVDVWVKESVYVDLWRIERDMRVFANVGPDEDSVRLIESIYQSSPTGNKFIATVPTDLATYHAQPGRAGVDFVNDDFEEFLGTEDEDTFFIGGPLGSPIAEAMHDNSLVFDAKINELSPESGVTSLDFVMMPDPDGFLFGSLAPSIVLENENGSFILQRHLAGSTVIDYAIIVRLAKFLGADQTSRAAMYVAGINKHATEAASFACQHPLRFGLGRSNVLLVVLSYLDTVIDYNPEVDGTISIVPLNLVDVNNWEP